MVALAAAPRLLFTRVLKQALRHSLAVPGSNARGVNDTDVKVQLGKRTSYRSRGLSACRGKACCAETTEENKTKKK